MTNEEAGFSAQTNEVTAAPCLLLPVDCSPLGPMNNVNIVWAGAHRRQGLGQTGAKYHQDNTGSLAHYRHKMTLVRFCFAVLLF